LIKDRSLERIVRIWFIALICYTAVNTIGDSISLMTGNLTSRKIVFTPVWVKLIKDVLLGMSVVIMAAKNARLNKVILITILTWLTLGILWAEMWVADLGLDVFMGIRYMLPSLYILFGYSFPNVRLDRVKYPLLGVLVLHVIFQLIQAKYAPNFFGHVKFGINLRNTGIFITPTFAGAFPLICYAWPSMGRVGKMLSVVSLILSNSTTCSIIFALYAGYKVLIMIKARQRLIAGIILVVIIVPLALVYLPEITGRGDGVWESSGTRGKIVTESLAYIPSIGKGFGLGTSMAVLRGVPGYVIADNTFISSLVSMGGVGLVATLIVMVVAFMGLLLVDGMMATLFIGMISTIIFFEAVPFVQILFFWAGQGLARRVSRERIHFVNA